MKNDHQFLIASFPIVLLICLLLAGCENHCLEPFENLPCKLFVLEAEIQIDSVEGASIEELSSISFQQGALTIEGTSTRRECKTGEEVLGTIYPIIRPVNPSGTGIFIGQASTAVRTQGKWSTIVNVHIGCDINDIEGLVEIFTILIPNDTRDMKKVDKIAE